MKFIILVLMVLSLVTIVPIGVEAQKGLKTYTVEDEYSFKYPSNWKLEERENRFTSVDARLEYGNNDVQVIFERGEETLNFASNDQLLGAMKTVIESKNSGAVFESGLDKYVFNNQTAAYAIGTYETEPLFGSALNMVVFVTGVHIADNELVLVQYVAEENDFDKYFPKVEEVLNSISPINADNTESPVT
jgi:hypothetical protein